MSERGIVASTFGTCFLSVGGWNPKICGDVHLQQIFFYGAGWSEVRVSPSGRGLKNPWLVSSVISRVPSPPRLFACFVRHQKGARLCFVSQRNLRALHLLFPDQAGVILRSVLSEIVSQTFLSPKGELQLDFGSFHKRVCAVLVWDCCCRCSFQLDGPPSFFFTETTFAFAH